LTFFSRLLIAGFFLLPILATAEEDEDWAVHAQATAVVQWHPAFHADYSGPRSLDPKSQGNETADATLYAGTRLWAGAEAWADVELDQGFGLSDTVGVAGFTSGEAYKVGEHRPYFRLPRAFIRQTIDLGAESAPIDSDLNTLARSASADRLVITFGKFGVTDIFDTNQYAHDPRADFMNWSIIDLGSFDYAADAWGFTYGAAAELSLGEWTGRFGVFDGSTIPNDKALDPKPFDQSQEIVEIEHRHRLFGEEGKIKLLAFLTEARLGSYDDAVALAQATGGTPDTALVRRMRDKAGAGINLEQPLVAGGGVFLRAGVTQGNSEVYEFADINRSLSFGGSFDGREWDRPDDRIGTALAFNGISEAAKRYFAAGGLGILVGDGQLPNAAGEKIWESYYSFSIIDGVAVSADYQFVDHPAYNRDRGPVSVLAARAHIQF
jgi:high affinity Mn2+ porin